MGLLLAIDGPSGDEGALADWLAVHLANVVPDAVMERLGDNLLAVRGHPAVAIFAHLDTTGFTLGYGKELIPIGGPAPKTGDPLRPVHQPAAGNRFGARGHLVGKTDAPPGSRWVYASGARQADGTITGPYLDNRAGIWAALQVLRRCPNAAVAFTVGEETSGKGAAVCARRLYEEYGITQALIADITWDTIHVHCGQGVAVSLRDRSVPRRRYLDQILALAEASGIPFQREIESSGGSDGGGIDRSGVPMDWVFVGAPERDPHTSAEALDVQDLMGMADLLTYLVDALTPDPSARVGRGEA